MKKNHDKPADAAELRRRAEERLNSQRPEDGRQRTEAGSQQTIGDTQRLVHELQVHQIELEMQNEELKASQTEVELGLAHYANLYDFAPTGYLTLDREGTIRLVNLTGARLLGVERSRLVQRRFGQFVAEGDRRAFSDFLEKLFTGGARGSCEVLLLREGPEPCVVRIEGTRFEDGQECHTVVLDITERKRAEAALRESEEKFTKAFQRAPVLVNISTLEDGVFLDVNDEFLAVSGYSREELIGKTSTEVGWATAKGRSSLVAALHAKGRVKGMELERRTKSGRIMHGLVGAEIIRLGGRDCLVSVMVDITERKRVEAKLAEQLDELRRWHQATLGRERRVLDLKQEVNALLAERGQPPRYASVAEEDRTRP
jgi:PAS domain S-box-containing protein